MRRIRKRWFGLITLLCIWSMMGLNAAIPSDAIAVGDPGVKKHEFLSLRDFGAIGNNIADDTAAIQAALNTGRKVLVPPGAYLFRELIMAHRGSALVGENPATCILKHTGNGVAITLMDTTSNDPAGRGLYVDSGRFQIQNLGLLVNGTVGIECGRNRTALSDFTNLHIRHRRDLEDGIASQQYFPKSIGISANNVVFKPDFAVYLSKIDHCWIRGFETGVALVDTVNGIVVDSTWIVECKNAVLLDGANSTMLRGVYIESRVSGARGVVFGAKGAGFATLSGCVFELTDPKAASYAYDFSAGGRVTGLSSTGSRYLIAGDGNGVIGMKYTGTAPTTWLEVGRTCYSTSLAANLPMIWAPGTSTAHPLQMSGAVKLGGVGLGGGNLLLSRPGSDANNASIANDGYHGLIYKSPGTGESCDHIWQNATGATWMRLQTYDSPSLYPGLDNKIALGRATNRWGSVYTSAGVIMAADAREEQQVRSLSHAEKAVAARLKGLIRAFKHNDEVAARGKIAQIHVGVIAQDVKAAFEAEGLVAEDYGILCYDEWGSVREERDKAGNVITPARSAGDRYGVRYDELLAFIVSVN